MAKVSLIGQILEVEREIAWRKKNYPRMVAKGELREAEAELLIGRMEAIRPTLLFCRDNEADIRDYIAQRKSAEADGREAGR